MSTAQPASFSTNSLWVRFWHEPVRAERLALTRILLAFALLTDELYQYLRNIPDFFGPGGVAPAFLFEPYASQTWRLSYVFFGTDNLIFIYAAYALWVAATVSLLVGWHTRISSIVVWFMTRCFNERNPLIIASEDDVLQAGLLLLMLAPCGAALSLDARRKRRQGTVTGPVTVAPWSVRLIQIQLALIYFTTGLAKLKGMSFGVGPISEWFTGSWWDGTALHYFLNDSLMARRSYAEYPVPFWITATMTYVSVSWEVLFPLLVLNRWTRRPTLLFGLAFHLGIMVTVEIGWFSFYTWSLYGVWTSDAFWKKGVRSQETEGRRNAKTP